MIGEADRADAAAVQLTCLFDKHHGEIYGYLARLLNDRAAAEDLVQETFLRAFRARNQIASLDNPRAWLYKIATNLAINAVKRRQRLAWLPWSAARRWESGQADIGEQVSTQTAVEEALGRLPVEYQAPLLLSIHFGLTIDELASTLGCSAGAVKVRLFRAREMFRQAWRKGEAE